MCICNMAAKYIEFRRKWRRLGEISIGWRREIGGIRNSNAAMALNAAKSGGGGGGAADVRGVALGGGKRRRRKTGGSAWRQAAAARRERQPSARARR
jgi:hypothetical protein